MPELPEVETVVRGLRPVLVGNRIDSIIYNRSNLRLPFPIALPLEAPAQTITAVTRQSKYILVQLSKGGTILLHLGMTGRLLFYEPQSYQRDKHDHVVIALKKGPLLVFNDARRFGVFDYIPPDGDPHTWLENTGLDPFDDALTPDWLLNKTQNKKTDFKAFLMDQRVIAGLGNIYVCEALFTAKIDPRRLVSSLTKVESKRLVPAICTVLNASIEAGGSSLRDYVQTSGELGFFQDQFQVYGRTGQPCQRCKTPIARIVQAGRSTFFCPACQK